MDEGPKVKVGVIDVQGNTVFNDKDVIRAMKNLHPIGVPHGLFLENLFAKSFDSTKLEQDQDMVRNFYQEHGYFTARVVDHKVTVVDVGGHGLRLPLIKPNKPGKNANIQMTVEEGRLYRLRKINFVGVKLFKTPETLMRPLFQMQEGDVFSTAKLRKGMENMRKLYGEFGYIDFVPEPDPEVVQGTDHIDLTFNVDEGKQFFVRRIDFSGNTTTRDKVIRRELLIDEGDMYNTRLWEISVLRLNQLGYFEQLKAEDAATISRDPKTNTVDLTLKVKERGKNSIQLNGGVSGIAGSFVGFQYATNNFLGLGETLSLDAQLGTRIRNATFGFTEPYLFDKPIQTGFTIYTTRFNYDQAREASILSGQNLIPLYNQLGTQQPFKLRFHRIWLHDVCQLSDEEVQLRPRRHIVRLRYLEHPHVDHGLRHVLQLHRFPGRRRSEPIDRNQNQQDNAVVQLQHRQPPDYAYRRQVALYLYFLRGQRAGRQRQHAGADH